MTPRATASSVPAAALSRALRSGRLCRCTPTTPLPTLSLLRFPIHTRLPFSTTARTNAASGGRKRKLLDDAVPFEGLPDRLVDGLPPGRSPHDELDPDLARSTITPAEQQTLARLLMSLEQHQVKAKTRPPASNPDDNDGEGRELIPDDDDSAGGLNGVGQLRRRESGAVSALKRRIRMSLSRPVVAEPEPEEEPSQLDNPEFSALPRLLQVIAAENKSKVPAFQPVQPSPTHSTAAAAVDDGESTTTSASEDAAAAATAADAAAETEQLRNAITDATTDHGIWRILTTHQILPPLHPSAPTLLSHAHKTLREKFPRSNLSDTVIPTLARFGPVAIVLAATTELFNSQIARAWAARADVREVGRLWARMKAWSVDADVTTLEMVMRIRKEFGWFEHAAWVLEPVVVAEREIVAELAARKSDGKKKDKKDKKEDEKEGAGDEKMVFKPILGPDPSARPPPPSPSSPSSTVPEMSRPERVLARTLLPNIDRVPPPLRWTYPSDLPRALAAYLSSPMFIGTQTVPNKPKSSQSSLPSLSSSLSSLSSSQSASALSSGPITTTTTRVPVHDRYRGTAPYPHSLVTTVEATLMRQAIDGAGLGFDVDAEEYDDGGIGPLEELDDVDDAVREVVTTGPRDGGVDTIDGGGNGSEGGVVETGGAGTAVSADDDFVGEEIEIEDDEHDDESDDRHGRDLVEHDSTPDDEGESDITVDAEVTDADEDNAVEPRSDTVSR